MGVDEGKVTSGRKSIQKYKNNKDSKTLYVTTSEYDSEVFVT